MVMSASALVAAARPGSVASWSTRVNVTIPATWYAPGTNDFATFGHKHPSRRPPS